MLKLSAGSGFVLQIEIHNVLQGRWRILCLAR
jgi:hypothetical protein